MSSKINFTTLKIALIAMIVSLGGISHAHAREFAIKTNLLYDATLTANLGVEFQVAPKWTVDISGNLNAWKLSHQRSWQHWMLQPEARYWLCQPTHGHFFAANVIGGQFNFGGWPVKHGFLSRLHDYRYQGWAVGAGLAYGYSWILNRHWNLEAEIGLGYLYRNYDKFSCAGCGRKLKENVGRHYVGPTKAAINIVYVF